MDTYERQTIELTTRYTKFYYGTSNNTVICIKFVCLSSTGNLRVLRFLVVKKRL